MSNEDQEKWTEEYVGGATAGTRKRAEDTEGAVQQQQGEIRQAENARLMSREPKKTFWETLAASRDSPSDLTSSDNGADRTHEDDRATEQGQLSNDDEPCWVMGIIAQMVRQRMLRNKLIQMKLEEMNQPGWEDAADYLHGRNTKYSPSDLRDLAVIRPQTDDHAAAPVPTKFGERLVCHAIVPGISQLPPGTSRPGSSHGGPGL